MRSFRINSSIGLVVKFDVLANKPSVLFGGADGFKAAIETDRRLDVAVSEQPPYGLVVSWTMLEVNGRRGVPELMNRDMESGGFLDALCYLFAKLHSILRLTGLAGKHPIRVSTAKQCRSKFVDIFVNEIGQGLIKFEIQINAVLHIIVRENQPIRRAQPARFDEILAQVDQAEIAKANGREGSQSR